LQLGVPESKFSEVVASHLPNLPSQLAADIYAAVTDPDQGDHLGEAAFLSILTVGIDRYLSGINSAQSHDFALGFLLPLSAHDMRLDQKGVPQARYETAEMKILLESFRRIWMSDTVRTALVEVLAEYDIAIPTFACSGVAVVPKNAYTSTLDWYRESGWQRRRALVDQGNRTYGPERGFCTFADLPDTIDLCEDQISALRKAMQMAGEMRGVSLLGRFGQMSGSEGHDSVSSTA
jgi:hypothetical protein